jgi:hypothetical protein
VWQWVWKERGREEGGEGRGKEEEGRVRGTCKTEKHREIEMAHRQHKFIQEKKPVKGVPERELQPPATYRLGVCRRGGTW